MPLHQAHPSDRCAEPVVAAVSKRFGLFRAQLLAQTRAGARGALFFHACLPVSEFGTAWPDEVPVQVHAMDADPFFVDDGDIDAARPLVNEAKEGKLFLYPGDQHPFTDSSLSSYNAETSALLTRRVVDVLAAR